MPLAECYKSLYIRKTTVLGLDSLPLDLRKTSGNALKDRGLCDLHWRCMLLQSTHVNSLAMELLALRVAVKVLRTKSLEVSTEAACHDVLWEYV